MKTFVTTVIAVAMASTASFAAVGDMVSNGYGKTLEVTMQSTGSSGNTVVKLLNDAGQTRKFTVKANGKVKGKGGKQLKRNIRDMVEEDLRIEALDINENTEGTAQDLLRDFKGGNNTFLYDCSFNYGIDRIVEIQHGLPSAEMNQMDVACAS